MSLNLFKICEKWGNLSSNLNFVDSSLKRCRLIFGTRTVELKMVNCWVVFSIILLFFSFDRHQTSSKRVTFSMVFNLRLSLENVCLTFTTQTSVYVFLILLRLHFLWFKQGELVKQSRAS